MPDPADLEPTWGVVWSRPAEWERRRRADSCIICTSGGPVDVIAQLPTCWATAPPEAPLPGYVCVVARQHVIEPFEMTPDQQCQFWLDSMEIANAVASVTSPIKMNYEIHGNTLPLDLTPILGHLILDAVPEEGGPDGSSSEVSARVPA